MTENLFDYEARCKAFDEQYQVVCETIASAAKRAGRKPEEITLLAATKTVPAPVIAYAVSKGLCCIGENRVQELLEKYEQLPLADCDLQFIGKLQTNKVKYLVDKVSCIQSVDSEKLAQTISKACVDRGKVMPVLVEVNIGKEASKGGVAAEALEGLLEKLSPCPGIQVRGLMAIPPAGATEAEMKGYFTEMVQYYVDIKSKNIDNVSMDCLSMGMSDDYAAAIECGATMVRVGSALFGRRG